ncbi:MAG: hypothetical protein H7Y37_17760, partial [Anaerolineae bacterium]|nr:hypothetical protein [Gloeobacterales cyanobacterium ES-bin-313]
QSPSDIVYEARCDQLTRQTGDKWAWFETLALPYAQLRLKQGTGRLIRSRSDRGIVAILDPRMTRKNYGKTILRALPPMSVVRQFDIQRFESYLEES